MPESLASADDFEYENVYQPVNSPPTSFEILREKATKEALIAVIGKRLALFQREVLNKNRGTAPARIKESYQHCLEDLGAVAERLNEVMALNGDLLLIDLQKTSWELLETNKFQTTGKVAIKQSDYKAILEMLMKVAFTSKLSGDKTSKRPVHDKPRMKPVTESDAGSTKIPGKTLTPDFQEKSERNGIPPEVCPDQSSPREETESVGPVQEEFRASRKRSTKQEMESIPKVPDVDDDVEMALEKGIQQEAKKKSTIGIKGGRTELYGCKFVFPKNAVQQDTDCDVSADNNPANFPKDKSNMGSTKIPGKTPSPEFQEKSERSGIPQEVCPDQESSKEGTETVDPVHEEFTASQKSSTRQEMESISKAPDMDDDAEMALEEVMQQEAKKRYTIGIKGGQIELYRCKVVFPKNAVKQDTDFDVLIDNNPANFPEDKFPITPILDIEPSMDFDELVSVTMRTWFSATRGKHLDAQILQRSADGKWHKDQDVILSDKNEVTFHVLHFSGRAAVVREESEGAVKIDKDVEGDIHLFNGVNMHRGTGVIVSTLCKEEMALVEAQAHFQEYGMVLVPPAEIRGNVNSLITIELGDIHPEYLKFKCKRKENNPATFIGREALDKKCLAFYFRPVNFPSEHKGSFTADYCVTVRGSNGEEDVVEVDAVLSATFPMNSSAGALNVSVSQQNNNSKKIAAMQYAEKGSTVTTTEHGTNKAVTHRSSEGI